MYGGAEIRKFILEINDFGYGYQSYKVIISVQEFFGCDVRLNISDILAKGGLPLKINN